MILGQQVKLKYADVDIKFDIITTPKVCGFLKLHLTNLTNSFGNGLERHTENSEVLVVQYLEF